MKAHTPEFKNQIKEHGKEQDSLLIYSAPNDYGELHNEDLISITPHYEGAILKSVMKQLDIESNVDIPIGAEVVYNYGIKTRNDDVEYPDENYDYISFGTYYVYSSEKQEDTNTYKIVCYDRMINSMKEYENLNITYPITVRDYLSRICNFLNIEFASSSDNFGNYNRQIQNELYLDASGNSLGYTFRDVLDEIAQATGSTICINEYNELEVRYITNTGDYIDENYLKNINVNFGKKYGPINSIVLSRSAESDNVYIQDQSSIETNGLCEIKIKDNQIMNWNDRSDYLPDLLTKLGGLEYYLNDFTSTGICYYSLCDRYSIYIGENSYDCVMFNDEVNVTQGLQEIIHTDEPEQSETDYSKADKTDRKINQTYLIVDKQNQTIESVVSQTIDTGNPDSTVNKVSRLTQKVDSLESEIENVAGMVMTKDSITGAVTFTDTTSASEVIAMEIYPTSQSISYLYPRENLYPSDTLYMTDRVIRFHNNTTSEDFYYTLPDDLLYYNSTNYDRFRMDLESGTCEVIKKCKYNADGSVGLLASETTNSYTLETTELTEGVYSVYINGYSSGYISVTLMAKNIYTDQFYTKVETNTKISQTAESITAEANAKFTAVDGRIDENTARIVANANSITSEVSRATNSETLLSSRITQNADAITSEITDRQDEDNTLSSRISQTAKSIALSVNNGSTSSGITITATKEDGTTSSASGTIQMNGLVSFTNLSTSGETVINGANIQTGTLSADKITTGTLNGENVNIENIYANNINAGNLTNAGVYITNGVGFLRLQKTGSLHPWMSAINLAWDQGNGIGFCQASSIGASVPTPFARIHTNSAKALYITNNSSNININASGSGAAITAGTYVRVQGTYITSNQIRFNSNDSTTARIQSGGYGISLIPHNEYVYIGSASIDNRILTNGGDPSSKNVKKNFKEIELDKVYDDFKKVNVYDYEYKYSNLGNDNYGFVIDEIEGTDTLSKYFYNYKVVKKIEDGKLLQINDEEKPEQTLEVKEWDKNSYIKGMFIVMKSMQEQIEKQQKQIENLQNEINKLKEDK